MRWFREDWTKFVGYTVLVASVSWAVTKYLVNDGQRELLRAENDGLRTQVELYKEKVRFIQAERDQYLIWLEANDGTFPAVKKEVTRLEQLLQSKEKEVNEARRDTSLQSEFLYLEAALIKAGESYVDPKTAAIFGVQEVFYTKNAKVRVHLPGSRLEEKVVAPADSWEYLFEGNSYLITVRSVSFIRDHVEITVQEVPARNR